MGEQPGIGEGACTVREGDHHELEEHQRATDHWGTPSAGRAGRVSEIVASSVMIKWHMKQ